MPKDPYLEGIMARDETHGPDCFQRLKEDGATGLDMSPGNPNSAWAVQEIEALRARVAELEVDLRNIDYLLARRPELADKPTRFQKITYVLYMASQATDALKKDK